MRPRHCLVKPLHWSHGGLDVQGPNVLPVLLQQRDEEVHGKMNVLDEVVFSHADVADGDRQAEHLCRSMLISSDLAFEYNEYTLVRIKYSDRIIQHKIQRAGYSNLTSLFRQVSDKLFHSPSSSGT